MSPLPNPATLQSSGNIKMTIYLGKTLALPNKLRLSKLRFRVKNLFNSRSTGIPTTLTFKPRTRSWDDVIPAVFNGYFALADQPDDWQSSADSAACSTGLAHSPLAFPSARTTEFATEFLTVLDQVIVRALTWS